VIGEPTPEWGESVVAVLVKEPGHVPDTQEIDCSARTHRALSSAKRYGSSTTAENATARY